MRRRTGEPETTPSRTGRERIADTYVLEEFPGGGALASPAWEGGERSGERLNSIHHLQLVEYPDQIALVNQLTS